MDGKYYTITIKGENEETLTITTSNEADINDWKHIFISILTWLTFAPETIQEFFPDEESYTNPDGN
uniref:PH domain-containing protein n=1 Tax=viral metagenome TaxID=1070528 RepID=A0A6M3JE08_9ZZZZ